MKTYIYKGAQDFFYHDVCIAKLGETLEIGPEGIRNISNKNKFSKAPAEIIGDLLESCEEYDPALGIDDISLEFPETVNTDSLRRFFCLNSTELSRLVDLGVLKITEDSCRNYNVGNSNYSKQVIQPWAIWQDYDLNPWDADIVKRVLRTKVENGMTSTEARILDYQKIIHICKERIRQLNGTL